jgi:hypothetical protein
VTVRRACTRAPAPKAYRVPGMEGSRANDVRYNRRLGTSACLSWPLYRAQDLIHTLSQSSARSDMRRIAHTHRVVLSPATTLQLLYTTHTYPGCFGNRAKDFPQSQDAPVVRRHGCTCNATLKRITRHKSSAFSIRTENCRGIICPPEIAVASP